MNITLFFGLIGGLGLFLYGMQIMGEGLQKAAGDRMRRILETLTGKPIMGVITGTVVTSIIQSSSATTVMLVGFVNAGLMSLQQAIGVIFGANIGTTITAQMVAFNVGIYALPAIGIGFLLSLLGRRKSHRYFGEILLGFGLLFLGMNIMSDAMEPLKNNAGFISLLQQFGARPPLGILAGVVFTSIIQSSSATSGIVIALAMQGLLDLPAAIALIFGANIGTCITAILASIGTSVTARRTALAHVMFNVIGVIIFYPLLVGFHIGGQEISFVRLITLTSGELVRQVANAHTIFNIVNTLIMLPFVTLLGALVSRMVPGKELGIERGLKYLDKRIFHTPAIALGQANKEAVRLAEMTLEMLEEARRIIVEGDMKLVKNINQREDVVDDLEHEVVSYLSVLAQESLTAEQSNKLMSLMHVVSDIERIGDHTQNISELGEYRVEERLPLSETAVMELNFMFGKVREALVNATEAMRRGDADLAMQVLQNEDSIDQLEKDLRAGHIKRLNEGVCYPGVGVVFVDAIRNLERVADHANNMAHMVRGEL